MASAPRKDALSTRLVHGDDGAPAHPRNAVIAPISVTTTYRRVDQRALRDAPREEDDVLATDARFVYAREDHPVRERVERILGELEGDGGRAVLYATGLAAAYAAIGYVRPRRILVQPGGYHGVQEIIKMYTKRTGLVSCKRDADADADGDREGEGEEEGDTDEEGEGEEEGDADEEGYREEEGGSGRGQGHWTPYGRAPHGRGLRRGDNGMDVDVGVGVA